MDYFSYQNLGGAVPQSSFDRVPVDPRLNSFNVQPFPETLSQKFNADSNQQHVNSWLLEKGKLQPGFYLAASNRRVLKPKNEIPINVARSSLKSCLDVIQKLNETRQVFLDNVETMSSAEWKQKSLEIGCLRDEFDKLMLKFEDKQSLVMLRRNVKKRTKKRLDQKRRKRERKVEAEARKEALAKEHKRADQWLESKKDETERTKMDERLKKDADCVLYEVTKKKSDARKQLSLISALVKLRTVRDNMATQRGERLSLEDRRAFGSVTEKLIRMWENACQSYSKEEQCLQIMLEHNATEDSKAARLAKGGSTIDEWDRLLFGVKQRELLSNSTYLALTSAERDFETFVAIRKSWDTFLAKTNNISASSIPIGWVIPTASANEIWVKFIKR